MKQYYLCDARYLILDIPYPHLDMLAEAQRLSDRFVTHRGSDGEGWEALVLHGLGETMTDTWMHYGYTDGRTANKDMKWTDAAKECPITTDFLCNHFPSNRLSRVRFMKVKAGGYISPHSDSTVPVVENINLVLNNPRGCIWRWTDGGDVEMVPGLCYGMNTHYEHAVYNNSSEDRIHMIVERHDTTDEWRSLLDKAALAAGVSGSYFENDFLP